MSAERFCTTCGATGRPRRTTPGSFVLEVALWLLAIVLAAIGLWLLLVVPLLYSAGRFFARDRLSCRSCGASTVVPLDSPVARRMRQDLNPPA